MHFETYILLDRMLEAASTTSEIEIMLRRFQVIIESKEDSADPSEVFDAAWATSCVAGLYLRLNETFLASCKYADAISLFDSINMSGHSSALRLMLADMRVRQGYRLEAEALLRDSVRYIARDWGETHRFVASAKEELRHFQLTGEVVAAANHRNCDACGVDNDKVAPDDGHSQTKGADDVWQV